MFNARARLPVSDLSAWGLYQRSLWRTDQLNREDLMIGLKLLEEAVAREPTLASAQAQLAYQLMNGIRFDLGWDRQQTVERIEYHASLAKESDPLEAWPISRKPALWQRGGTSIPRLPRCSRAFTSIQA